MLEPISGRIVTSLNAKAPSQFEVPNKELNIPKRGMPIISTIASVLLLLYLQFSRFIQSLLAGNEECETLTS